MEFSKEELLNMNPAKFRTFTRSGVWTRPNLNVCRGYAMANLAIVPKDYAFEFLLFCVRNPQPCGLIDVTEPGDPHPRQVAPEADLRTDLPRYRVFKDGECVDEPTDVIKYWRDDLVAFLIGCSCSFDWALQAANVHYRLIGAYKSTIQCVPAGRFHGPMVVSCRFVNNGHDAVRAVQISSRMRVTHGPPVHIGEPSAIGIKNLYHPDFYPFTPTTPQRPDEIAMYWGCGVTPQTVAMESKVPFMITHCGGHMFFTDKLSEELAIL
ncbi:putative hydro-lyase [subsurface metagenome]